MAVELSPLAAHAAGVISHHHRRRVPFETVRDALLAVDLSLVASADARTRLAAITDELSEAGFVSLPKGARGWDRTILPPLPRWLLRPPQTQPPRPSGNGEVTWHATLGWAAAGGWTAEEERLLHAVNDWLIKGGPTTLVPLQERSLELLGDEKALARYLRGRLFRVPGRLTLGRLGAVRTSPPFVFTKTGAGPYALVVENSATYRSIVDALPADSPVGVVAFGFGNGFVASVEFFIELGESGQLNGPIQEIRYFGDIDEDGLRIAHNASRAASELGLPAVRPAIGLYQRLLDRGVRQDGPPLDPMAAAELASWLPGDLAERTAACLVAGQRLPQEAVGLELLVNDRSWATPDELGAATTQRPVWLRAPDLPSAEAALVVDDARAEQSPATDDEAGGWVRADLTRNHVLGDPLVDWLDRYGEARGYVADHRRPGYDLRTDFADFVSRKGSAFKAGVLRLLAEREDVLRIGTNTHDALSHDKAQATVNALRAGAPIIAQGVLWNPENRTYGMADFLVRSDVLARLFPGALAHDEVNLGMPALESERGHYRVVMVKFHTLELLPDGSSSGDARSLPNLVEAWLCNEALGRICGYTPCAAYLLGRSWHCGETRGTGCLERLARVDHDRLLPRRGATIGQIAEAATAWVRRLRLEGQSWEVLPTPSVPELYPHARNTEDSPWRAAKAEIAAQLRELTLLPRMNPTRRAAALEAGITAWDDARASASAFGLGAGAGLCDAVLAANRLPVPSVLPTRIVRADPSWRSRATAEFYVDFETTSSLDDDFTDLPAIGGQPLVFQIGCGHWENDEWRFAQWTAKRLTPEDEGAVIDAWVNHMTAVAAASGTTLAASRVVHWSAAEPVNLETAYNSARSRHPEATWPLRLPWFDFLSVVVRAEPVTVTGAFNFGLKSIAKAMHAAGLIDTTWSEGPTDGMRAMVGAWWCDADAERLGATMPDLDLMRDIAGYNEVDCRVMAEVVSWLRTNR